MKKLLTALTVIIFIFFLWVLLSLQTNQQTSPHSVIIKKDENVKGMFIATVYNIDFPKAPNQSSKQQKDRLTDIVATAKSMNLNTIYFQVVPSCDAVYNSKILPISQYLSTLETNDKNFDPLSFLIDEAKKQNIQIYAWINPYRVKSSSVENPVTNSDFLSPDHPARLKNLLIAHPNGSMYLDPSNPETTKLIVDTATELATSYDIAGVIFDDYFYPQKITVTENGKIVNKDFPDNDAYLENNPQKKSKEDWRRDNVTNMIKSTKQALASVGKKFGVSPFAIWANKTTNPLGSDTNGSVSTYYDYYADTLLWVKMGYVDFIMPQIYWNIGYKIADFSTLLKWWEDAVSGTDVKLYIAHAAYKVGDVAQNSAWQDSNEIKAQIELTKNNNIVKGNVLYGYFALEQNILGLKDTAAAAFK